MINKWYYKTIVLNIGPCLRPPGWPARDRSVRPAAARSVRPAAARSRLLGKMGPRPPRTRTSKNLQVTCTQECTHFSYMYPMYPKLGTSWVQKVAPPQ